MNLLALLEFHLLGPELYSDLSEFALGFALNLTPVIGEIFIYDHLALFNEFLLRSEHLSDIGAHSLTHRLSVDHYVL